VNTNSEQEIYIDTKTAVTRWCGEKMDCQAGYQTSCMHREFVIGAQAPHLRAPLADGTLVRVNDTPNQERVPSLSALSDVMGTGWFAADAASVKPGSTVVVVGDGAVGLLAGLSAKQMGAERIIVLSRHAPRQNIGDPPIGSPRVSIVPATRIRCGIVSVRLCDLTGRAPAYLPFRPASAPRESPRPRAHEFGFREAAEMQPSLPSRFLRAAEIDGETIDVMEALVEGVRPHTLVQAVRERFAGRREHPGRAESRNAGDSIVLAVRGA
jgi:hypothetical protein